ncbi:hypothetical protein F4803DRAFT_572056 [Xylaria telfairii]|nr:hypothetical protein F4803DRAFT_572056 [Xylaria telfairii]
MRLDREEEKVANRVKSFFANEPKYEFEKVAGVGAFAVTLCYRNRDAGPSEYRRIAVKAITGSSADIGSEIEFLKSLIWAQHIVTIISIPLQSSETRWLKDNTIITEYLENGTLDQLKKRLGRYNHSPRKLPNRVLWAIFLCRSTKGFILEKIPAPLETTLLKESSNTALVARGCVGMAYPPPGPRKAPRGPRDQLLETIPDEDKYRTPNDLAHGDLHSGNIMLGDLGRDEHSRFPLLKFIDFGLASRGTENAVEENISAIGAVMCELILQSGDIHRLIDDKRGANVQDPDLDPELLMIVAQCVAEEPARRPSLSRLLSIIRSMLRRTYPDIREETDAYISELVQNNIFNAA